MKKMIVFLMFVLCGAMTACIEDGPLPADDDSPDATVPDEPDATVPDDPPDAAEPSPDADPPEADAGTPDASPPDSGCGDTDAEPSVCHGLIVDFSAADVVDLDHCTGWSAEGLPVNLTPAGEVIGGDHVCAITCYRKVTGETVVPSAVSGVWVPGGSDDVPRWNKPGCKRLPDHPADEPDQAGGTWDGRCDKY